MEVRCSKDGKGLIKATNVEGHFVIPDSVTWMGKAFEDCTGLTSVVIPDSVTSIGRRTFVGCTGLTSIEIPNSVPMIMNKVFCGCTGLKEVHCKIKNIKDVRIGSSCFDSCNLKECTLYVPVGTDNDYRHHLVFSQFKEVVIELDN